MCGVETIYKFTIFFYVYKIKEKLYLKRTMETTEKFTYLLTFLFYFLMLLLSDNSTQQY